jgi:hypothetical protein
MLGDQAPADCGVEVAELLAKSDFMVESCERMKKLSRRRGTVVRVSAPCSDHSVKEAAGRAGRAGIAAASSVNAVLVRESSADPAADKSETPERCGMLWGGSGRDGGGPSAARSCMP